MNNPNASSLFHFTSEFETLKSIISDGLMFSYSYEEHDFTSLQQENLPDFKGIAMPMICFCNTPLSRVENHSRVYGKYFVAFDKEFVMDLWNPILNPVAYYNSVNYASSIPILYSMNGVLRNLAVNEITNISSDIESARRIIELMTTNGKTTDKIKNLPYNLKNTFTAYSGFYFASNFIIGLSKPIFGKNKLGEETFLDEEREWRAFMIDNYDDNIRWRFYDKKDEFDEEKEELKEIIKSNEHSHLTIPSIEWANTITFICTEDEQQIPELVNFILSSKTLFGYEITEETEYVRYYILSRLTSFERLSKDI